MAQINKIDKYNKPSSTEAINNQYGLPPKNVIIDNSTANAVKKDLDQGNVDLNNGQIKFLEGKVDEDTIDYSIDEMKKVGTQKINAKNTEGTKTGNAIATTSGSVVGSVAGGIAGTVGQSVQNSMINTATNNFNAAFAKNVQFVMKDGKPTMSFKNPSEVDKAAQECDKASQVPFGAVIAGGIALAGSVLAMVSANNFDDQYSERVSKLKEAENTNAVISEYYDLLSSDMDAMVEDSSKYSELGEVKLQSDVDLITEIGALQAECQVYLSQGNSEKAGEIDEKITILKEEGEQNGIGGEMDSLRENMEQYRGNAAESAGVKESGDSVSEFLKQGKTMGILAAVQCTLMVLSAVLMLKGTINAIKAAAKVPSISGPFKAAAIACAIAGSAMMVAANVTTVLAALKMKNKMSNEFDCASAGSDMASKLTSLGENLENQEGFTETVEGDYVEQDTKAAETTQKTQEGVNKANQNSVGKTNNNTQGTVSTGSTVGGNSGNNSPNA